MTELSFLIDLLMDHKLPKATKEIIAERIKLISEMGVDFGILGPPQKPIPTVKLGAQQAPSTLALMAKHGDIPPIEVPAPEVPEPVAVIAQTPATAAAMASRQQAIAESIAGKIDKTTGRPKKW